VTRDRESQTDCRVSRCERRFQALRVQGQSGRNRAEISGASGRLTCSRYTVSRSMSEMYSCKHLVNKNEMVRVGVSTGVCADSWSGHAKEHGTALPHASLLSHSRPEVH
jgi:hypothetical protein